MSKQRDWYQNFSLHLSTEQIVYFLCSCSGRVFSFSSEIVRLLYYFFYGLAEHVDAHSCLLDKFSEYDPGLVAALKQLVKGRKRGYGDIYAIMKE